MPPDVAFVLGDSMGEMPAYYAAADVAFVGGSLLPLGGQNLIEAIAAGRPTLVGPHMFNFAEATANAIAAGAARQVPDADALVAAVSALLGRPGSAGGDGRRRGGVPCRAPRRGRAAVGVARAGARRGAGRARGADYPPRRRLSSSRSASVSAPTAAFSRSVDVR